MTTPPMRPMTPSQLAMVARWSIVNRRYDELIILFSAVVATIALYS